MTNLRSSMAGTAISFALASLSPVQAQEPDTLLKRLDRIEQENRELKREVELLKLQSISEPSSAPAVSSGQNRSMESPTEIDKEKASVSTPDAFIVANSTYTFSMLDPTKAGKAKPLYLLAAKRDHLLSSTGLYVGGALTAVADYQASNFSDDFGYLMRHPGTNHVGKTVSEVVVHSVQLQTTANIAPWISTYSELLYDPQQSFGSGSITSLTRNQLQVRRAYVVLGDLARSPFYAVIGKLDTPFGQTDTVNPFTLSTDWHTFSGLSYGAMFGYAGDRLNVALDVVQGGAQFRGLNTPVEGTSTPSKVNNYVIDANYTLPLGSDSRSLLIGGSYERGSSFCQQFPVTHFGTCTEPNPAYAVYATAKWNGFMLKGNFASTTHAMPGTFNPNPPLDIYKSHAIVSFDVGAKYTLLGKSPIDLSFDYSTLIAGPKSAPWRRQDQWVAGFAIYPQANVRLFSEAILVGGYLPFNFLTGGNPGADVGTTESSTHKKSQVIVIGITAAM